tara:strand:- start:6045 stop:6431 length:387 start_codon:yes stop_codon:yes gene_type:complete
MFIGIVGSSKAGEDSVDIITNYLSTLDPEKDTIVSGAGRGVDTIAANIAKTKKFNLIEYASTGYSWDEFKKRNLQIAEKADKVVSFAYPFKTTKCYHCANAGRDDNHEKTAGCYTGMKNGNYEVIIII